MSDRVKSIAKAASRALIDMVALAALLPAIGIAWTRGRLAMVMLAYMFGNLGYTEMVDIALQVKTIVAEIREEGWDGLKVRCLEAVAKAYDAAITVAACVSTLIGDSVHSLLAFLGLEAPSTSTFTLIP